MRRAWRTMLLVAAGALTLPLAGCGARPSTSDDIAEWAYPYKARKTPPIEHGDRIVTVPGSTQRYTYARAKDVFNPPDWFPGDHPPMPRPVAHGTPPDGRACGYCHTTLGLGRPENAALAGLSADYIIEQVRAFRDGSRRSTGKNEVMNRVARAVSDADVAEAARYFAALPFRSYGRVVESDTVPRFVLANVKWVRAPGNATEPIGHRLIELPDDESRVDIVDPHATFTTFVPRGSIARGAELAAHWQNGEKACSLCHGDDYRGTALAPPLAGRSASYLLRQLNDIKTAHRLDPGVSPMQQVARDMTSDDMIALAAFMASRKPS